MNCKKTLKYIKSCLKKDMGTHMGGMSKRVNNVRQSLFDVQKLLRSDPENIMLMEKRKQKLMISETS